MDKTLLFALLVVCTFGSVAHGSLNQRFRRSVERAIDPVDKAEAPSVQSPIPGSDLGGAQRVESIDFQSDRVNAAHNVALIHKAVPGQPAHLDASGESTHSRNLGEVPQTDLFTGNASRNHSEAAEQSDASVPAHKLPSEAQIAHHEYIPFKYESTDMVDNPLTPHELSLPNHLPMPGIGPLPPNYKSNAPVPKLTKPDVSVFLCDFENHNCGMRNQENIGQHFKLERNILQSHSGRSMVVRARDVGYNVSRLITPYLPGYPNAKACLSLSYIVHGEGVDRIEIVAQDTSNRHLFMLSKDGADWRHFQGTMEVNQDVRFFIEAYTKSRDDGMIAIDNFGFSFTPCENGRRE